MRPLTRGVGLISLVLLLPIFSGTAAAAGKDTDSKLDAQALAGKIDQAIGQRLDTEKLQPSPLADDAEFLRRAYLDITGVIPTTDKAIAFLDNTDPDKRAKLIDELLASPQYGRHLADVWQALMLPRNSDNRRLQGEPLVKWLEEQFNANTHWDKLVSDLLTASGPQDKNGAVTYFLANPTADKVNDSVCRLFLGVQLQCAQCHNHPFTGWKQTEYWAMAAFFMKVRPDNVRKADKQGGVPAVVENDRPMNRKNQLPESAKMVPAKFLLGEQPKLDPNAPYRPVLAKWMTSPQNPFFAKAMVNRMWSQFFGRGFVNPVDNMHDGNPASHPELLQQLTAQFTANDFDLKYLVRAICNSQAYQRTSKPAAGNDSDTTLFSHMAVKVLSAEQLFDSYTAILGNPQRGGRDVARKPAVAGKGAPVGQRAQFVAFFQTEDGADPTEYQAGIPQALRLMNSNEFLRGGNLAAQLVKPAQNPAQNVEHLYLTTLSRRPSTAEAERLTAYVQKNDVKKAYGDILWALLNSSEFTLNH